MTADLLFTGGRAFVDGRSQSADVAVTDGRISAVGADAGDQAGDRTERVDLTGRLLIPGFQDAHVHPVGAGVELGRCDLSDLIAVDDVRRRISDYASTHPDVPWITGGGWSMETFPGGTPTRQSADDLVADRPLYLTNRDHHGGWANSRALQIAGIDARTPDPPDGRIEREADGTPTGMLQEGAMDLVARHLPATTDEESLAGLLRAQEVLHSLGVTAWQDALVGDAPLMADVAPAYQSALDRGLLTARVVAALWWRRDQGAEQIPHLVERRDRLSRAGFAATSVKIMQDGVAENHTAAMLSPYLRAGCPCAPGGRHDGLSFVDPALLPGYVTQLDALGFQVHFHALGDRAVREALDAVAAARAANGPTDTRPHLAHLQVVHPDDIARFAELDAIANIQPLWAAHEPQMDDLTIPFLGPERSAWQYPFASLVASGAALAAGSDWPVSSPDPIEGIHVAVNRIEAHGDAAAFYPEQRIDVATALTAYTRGSALANHLDDSGTIAVGRLADLAVLSGDLLGVPAEEICDVAVEQTFVGGRRVHGH